ncbi:hypothetical protein MBEHAL_0840 [Halarchaeum acidiphilum MH1-52-1]|uniref:Uncharacterized protein n=1 Tax=Halarchaeum acidiphilum MH1-52-1 TaxID=1261545 RepID=U2YSU2_9EURY|nr:hypothetical protein [Halarchaeum acidiphilum]GAD52080.1 hypothetical protein MBEHAL_0840 [Halarchaeum acidiphilum MH1-52-1]
MDDTVPVGEWVEVTEERARETERRWRYRVTPTFAVDLWVSKSSDDETCPYHVLLSTINESDGRHVSDHPVAGYGTREGTRDALADLRDVVDDVLAERDEIPDPEHRLAHAVIPRFIDDHLTAECACRSLYDRELV